MTLEIRRADVWRATLSAVCGNVGYIGLAPDGSAYHVVVPVDLQIARGVKAGNRPEDGTPFGGYQGWFYFECPPCSAESENSRRLQTEINAELLKTWAREKGMDVTTG
ncbi:MAG: hypothetical protein AB1641_08545 [Thermodesulfobacteriota bacterium]